MKRIVILGGSGFFGGLIAEKLRAAGLQPLIASRRGGDLRLDVNRPEDLAANLKQRDLIIDAAGPFQKRSTALIDVAIKMGMDVIDLSDSPDYARKIYEREQPIRAAGIRVLTSCSMLSTFSALVLKEARAEQPRRLSAYLVPASRYTANPATAAALLTSLEGGTRNFRFPSPLGRRSGVTVQSVDAITLRPLFRSIKDFEFVVDSQIPGMTVLLQAARWGPVSRLIQFLQPAALGIAHRVGPKRGVAAYEIATPTGNQHKIFTGERSHVLAVLPAVLATIAITAGRFKHGGLVPPTEHVDSAELLEAVRHEGITITPR